MIANNSYLFPAGLNTTDEMIEAMLKDIEMCGFNATIWTCEGKDKTWSKLMGMYYKVAAKYSLRTILNVGNYVPVIHENPSGGILYSPFRNFSAASRSAGVSIPIVGLSFTATRILYPF